MKDMGDIGAVFDSIGFESFHESYDILNSHGIVVGFSANKYTLTDESPVPATWLTIKFLLKGKLPWRGKRTAFSLINRDQPDYQPNMNTLLDLVGKANVSMPIRKIWDMDDIQEAHRQWHSGSGVGAVIIRIPRSK